MLFPFIFKISTHMGPLEDTKKKTLQQFLKTGILASFLLLFFIVEVLGVINPHSMIKQYKPMVILRDFPFSALFGLVSLEFHRISRNLPFKTGHKTGKRLGFLSAAEVSLCGLQSAKWRLHPLLSTELRATFGPFVVFLFSHELQCWKNNKYLR